MQDVISSKGKKGKKRGSQLRALALIETGQFSGHSATARICGYITHVFDCVVFLRRLHLEFRFDPKTMPRAARNVVN